MTPPVRDTHTCPCGCGGQVPRHQLACKPGWFRLPADLRGWVGAAYRTRRADPDGHFRALRAAIQWYRDHPRTA
jgi:hypothetical protein